MSYILDALRKSERERALGNIPSLATQPTAPRRRRRAPRLWLALAVVLIAAGLAGGWLWLRPALVFTPKAKSPATPVPPAAAPRRVPDAAAPVVAPAVKPVQLPAQAAPDLAPAGPAQALKDATGMRLSVLSYSEVRERRFVLIGQNRYVEGDTLPGGYVLESITPDGAVITARGERLLIRP